MVVFITILNLGTLAWVSLSVVMPALSDTEITFFSLVTGDITDNDRKKLEDQISEKGAEQGQKAASSISEFLANLFPVSYTQTTIEQTDLESLTLDQAVQEGIDQGLKNAENLEEQLQEIRKQTLVQPAAE